MATTNYTIQQHIYTRRQWEAIPDGDFETAEAAIAGMRQLETSHGWRDLRVVKNDGERHSLSGHLQIGNDTDEVIEDGLGIDEDAEC